MARVSLHSGHDDSIHGTHHQHLQSGLHDEHADEVRQKKYPNSGYPGAEKEHCGEKRSRAPPGAKGKPYDEQGWYHRPSPGDGLHVQVVEVDIVIKIDTTFGDQR